MTAAMLFFEELKRRNVIRLGLAYVASSWLIVQAAETVFPAFGIGPGGIRTVIIILAIGLLPTLIFAWVFELTPEGLKLERDVDRDASVTLQTGKKLDRAVIAILALALSYFAIDKFILDPSRDAADIEAATERIRSETIVDSFGDKSIVVLPFADMSDSGDQEYFSDGIAEELINLLASVPDLRVISRSSAFSFKGSNIDIPTIAEKLSVGHVLEGSVRKSGDRLRITTQLIEARSDTHLWSQTYDRNFDDIFSIQDDIAAEVVAQLKVKLLVHDTSTQQANAEAYALYLQAHHIAQQASARSFEQAEVLFKQALEIDPNLVDAWNGLSRCYVNQAGYGLRPADEGYELGREATKHLLTLDPSHAIGHSRLGWIAMTYDRDLEAAATHMETAYSLAPRDPAVASNVAVLGMYLGRFDESVALLEFAITRDPANFASFLALGQAYYWAGRLDQALAALQTALTLSPDSLFTNYSLGATLLMKGETEAALASMSQEGSEMGRLIGLAVAYYASGLLAEADISLAELIAKYGSDNAYNIASVLAYRGENDRAFEWLSKAEQSGEPSLAEVVGEPLFANLHDDPRWLPFLRQLGKAPEQLSNIRLELDHLPD